MRLERIPVARLGGLTRGLEAISKRISLPSYRIGVTGGSVRVWSVYDGRYFVWWEAVMLGVERPFRPGSWGCVPGFSQGLRQLIADHGRKAAAACVIVDRAGISFGLGGGRFKVAHGGRSFGRVPDDPAGPKGCFSAPPPGSDAVVAPADCLGAVVGFAEAASTGGGLAVRQVGVGLWRSTLVVTDGAGVTAGVAVAGEDV